MGFLDSVILPNNTKISSNPVVKSGGFLNSVIMPTAESIKIANLNTEQSSYDQVSKNANSLGGIVNNTLSDINSKLPPVATKSWNPVNWFVSAAKDLKGSVDTFANNAYDAVGNLFNPKVSVLDSVISTGKAGMDAINVAIGAVMSPLSAASHIPVVGYAVDGLNKLFGVLGQGGSNIAGGTVDLLPVSQQTKDKIKPLVQEIGSLSAQIIGGKVGVDVIGKYTSLIKDKSTQIVDSVKTDPNITPHLETKNISTSSGSSFVDSVIKPETAKENTIKKTPLASTEQVNNGNAVSGVAKSIEAKAIEAKLTTEFPDKATFESSTFTEQANKTADLINSGVDNARAVVRGDLPMPEGLKAAPLIAGMEEYAKLHPTEAGDIMSELANSHLATTISTGASETSFARMREPDSTSAKLAEIRKAKTNAAGGEKVVTAKKSVFMKEATRNVLPKEEVSWEKFLDSIKC